VDIWAVTAFQRGRGYLRPARWLVRHARFLSAHVTLAASSFVKMSASPIWASYRTFLTATFRERRKAEVRKTRPIKYDLLGVLARMTGP
jgi:hypothetical protein